jgi:hypothetical protein
VVLALVEEQPRLLAVPRVDEVRDRPLPDLDLFGHLAVREHHFLGQPLEGAHLRIVAQEDATRLQQFHEQFDDQVAVRVGALRQGLDHEHVRVAIHDERREQVRLAVHETHGRPVEVQAFAHCDRRREPAAPERAVDGRGVAGEHAQRDLRFGRAERPPEQRAPTVADLHHGAAIGLQVRHVGAIDPGVSGAHAVHPLAGDDGGRGAWGGNRG